MTDYTVGVLEDAIKILEALEKEPGGISLALLTEASGFVKNKVFRILFTLEKHHLVERDSIGQFHLGLRLLELGQQVQSRNILFEACQPVLDRLAEATGESIFLGVISGVDALCIAARESLQNVRLYAQVGRRAPLHSGGVPKTLLAHMPEIQRRRLLESFVENSHIDGFNVDLKKLEASLTLIQKQGYAVVADELDKGAHSVAAPICNRHGRVIAALSIAGPSHRFTEDAIDRYIQMVVNATKEISYKLGYEPEGEN